MGTFQFTEGHSPAQPSSQEAGATRCPTGGCPTAARSLHTRARHSPEQGRKPCHGLRDMGQTWRDKSSGVQNCLIHRDREQLLVLGWGGGRGSAFNGDRVLVREDDEVLEVTVVTTAFPCERASHRQWPAGAFGSDLGGQFAPAPGYFGIFSHVRSLFP